MGRFGWVWVAPYFNKCALQRQTKQLVPPFFKQSRSCPQVCTVTWHDVISKMGPYGYKVNYFQNPFKYTATSLNQEIQRSQRVHVLSLLQNKFGLVFFRLFDGALETSNFRFEEALSAITLLRCFLHEYTQRGKIARVKFTEELGTNRLRWITLVRGPIWGIHSLTLMISCLNRTVILFAMYPRLLHSSLMIFFRTNNLICKFVA